MRGDVSIRCRKAESGKETVLDISIAPEDARLFAWLFLIACIAFLIVFIRDGSWWFVGPLLMAGFLLVILAMCRSIGESEVPVIQREFENTLRQLEKKYKEAKP